MLRQQESPQIFVSTFFQLLLEFGKHFKALKSLKAPKSLTSSENIHATLHFKIRVIMTNSLKGQQEQEGCENAVSLPVKPLPLRLIIPPTNSLPVTSPDIENPHFNSHSNLSVYNEGSMMDTRPDCRTNIEFCRSDLLAVSVRFMTERGMQYSLSEGLDVNQLTQEELDSIPLLTQEELNSIPLLDLSLDGFSAMVDELAAKYQYPSPVTPPKPDAEGNIYSRADLLATSVRWLEVDGMHYSLTTGLPNKSQLTQEELESITFLDTGFNPGYVLPDNQLKHEELESITLLDPGFNPAFAPEQDPDSMDIRQSIESTSTPPAPIAPRNSFRKSTTPVPTSDRNYRYMPSTPTPEPLTPQ